MLINMIYGIITFPLLVIKTLDLYIMQIYYIFTNSIDSFCKNNKYKNIFSSSRLIFITYYLFSEILIFNNIAYFMSNKNFTIIIIDNIVTFLNYITIFVLIFIYIYLLKESSGIIKNTLINKQKNHVNECKECRILKPIRSYHCNICNYCVSKFEFHSRWLNKDIGSNNSFLYFLFSITFIVFKITIIFKLLIYCLFNEKDYLLSIKISLITIVNVYLSIKIISFQYNFIISFVKNITLYESKNITRLPYLWKSFKKNYFNPFDRGYINNTLDMLYSWEFNILKKFLKSKETKYIDKNNTNNKILKITSVNNKACDSEDSVLNTININTEDLEENINNSNTDNLFNPDTYNPSELKLKRVNWTKLRLYTILDIKNSPIINSIPENIIKQYT